MGIYLSAQCELRNFTGGLRPPISLTSRQARIWRHFSIGWLISTISNNGNGGETSGFQPQ